MDRDGTLNVQVGYCGDPAKMELIPGAAHAIRLFNEVGLLTIIVTNQSAVARGLITEEQVRRVNAEVALLVAKESGGCIDAFYYAPFHPTAGDDPRYTRESDWRKPGGGMLRQAARDFGIDLAHSFMIGDGDIDHQAGKDAHSDLVTFQVPGKYSSKVADHVVDSVEEAAAHIATLMGSEERSGSA